ncbi:hypothetical protein K2173_005293 [Erythroxylum novogranatense]|uniref:RRM domain-containing protein n=1 Tax=Erythroxylum novogranatense TaxID=1862640 RepID=A0AAV8TRV8_9ROSI|nr:hypothetical protein K2173_005293 [Erythroxylum novogranatense]
MDTSEKLNKKPKLMKKKKKKNQNPKIKKIKKINSPPPPSNSIEDLTSLLEPFTKDQLIELISIEAQTNPSLFSAINQFADKDISHRKIFVHGLPWDTTTDRLFSAFQTFGEIEDCNLVTDKASGRAKGYGFVVFKTRKDAVKALRDPKMEINNRVVNYQLACLGPPGNNANSAKDNHNQDVGARKIYVSNVHQSVGKEKLRAFFAKFGEIESGPIGFDKETGKSKGYALFVYKSLEGARKALEVPFKMFEGQVLHCSIATDGKSKSHSNTKVINAPEQQYQQQQQQQLVPQQPPQQNVLAALAAAQNLALFGQLNPTYVPVLGQPSTAVTNAGGGGGSGGWMISPGMASAANQSVVPGMYDMSPTMVGTHGTGQAFQQVYPHGEQIVHGGMVRGGQAAGGSFPGTSSYT